MVNLQANVEDDIGGVFGQIIQFYVVLIIVVKLIINCVK